jgi:hypothetical protein
VGVWEITDYEYDCTCRGLYSILRPMTFDTGNQYLHMRESGRQKGPTVPVERGVYRPAFGGHLPTLNCVMCADKLKL